MELLTQQKNEIKKKQEGGFLGAFLVPLERGYEYAWFETFIFVPFFKQYKYY